MIRIIDISNCNKHKLSFRTSSQQNEETVNSKGWSYSFVYDFKELRDVYLLIENCQEKNIKNLYKEAININLPFKSVFWKERRLLEHVNALINFGLIDQKWNIVNLNLFNTSYNEDISVNDKNVFKEIFLNYFRFTEISKWFLKRDEVNLQPTMGDNPLNLDILQNKSFPLFHSAYFTRFTDLFFFELNLTPEVYYIPQNEFEDQKRFWDVFIKWGVSLGLIEKFSLEFNGYKTETGKSISTSYFIAPSIENIDIVGIMRSDFNTRQIEVPSLLLNICLKYRISLANAKSMVIETYENNKQLISLERTSEVFIKKGNILNEDKMPYIKYRDAYISHIILRK